MKITPEDNNTMAAAAAAAPGPERRNEAATLITNGRRKSHQPLLSQTDREKKKSRFGPIEKVACLPSLLSRTMGKYRTDWKEGGGRLVPILTTRPWTFFSHRPIYRRRRECGMGKGKGGGDIIFSHYYRVRTDATAVEEGGGEGNSLPPFSQSRIISASPSLPSLFLACFSSPPSPAVHRENGV